MAEKWDFVEKRRKYNMLDKRSEDQIQHAYDRQKKGRTKGFLVLLVVYILMIGIVSLFLGNPIPHKETLLFFSIWDYGWIYTYPYLVVLCGVVGLAFSLIWIYYIILRDLIKIDEIVLQQCDVEMYLETMKYGVAYGKKLKFKGFQKSLFMLLQQRLSMALGYTGALKAPVRCFGNHLSEKRKSLFQTDNKCGGAAILKNRTSRMGTPVGC